MMPTLYAHPFSSYSQKVLVALYENATPFTYRRLGPDDADAGAEMTALWPMQRFPVLRDGAATVAEASIIVEHLDLHHPGPTAMLPADRAAALEVRFLDRFFDNYIQTPMQLIVGDTIRDPAKRDAHGVAEARVTLDRAYAWLDAHMAGRTWAVGDAVSLADCAAAPALFYADWTHPIGDAFANVRAYRRHLNAWPSFARAVEEARPYRPLFPPGAPDRD